MRTIQLKILVLILIILAGRSAGRLFVFADGETDITIMVDCFYFNACASCDEETELIQLFHELTKEIDREVKVIYKMHNTFHENEKDLLVQYYETYGVPENERYIPVLFIGDTYLFGIEEIKKSLKTVIDEYVLYKREHGKIDVPDLSEHTVNNGKMKYTVAYNKTDDSELIYFYLPSCKDCEKAEKILKELPETVRIKKGNEFINSKVRVIKLNAGEEENLALLKARFEYFKVPVEEQQVPIIFLGSTWISGAEKIQSRLETAVMNGHGLGTVHITLNGAQSNDTTVLSFLSIFLTGLLNGLNPCSLSMLIFFFSVLLFNERTKIFSAGMTFIAGKFTAFLLLGTVLYRVFIELDLRWVQTTSKIILVCIGFIFTILNIRDYIHAKNEKYDKILVQLPVKLRKLDHSLIKAVSRFSNFKVFIPLCFVLGVLIAVGEFMCTGQIYLATIVLMLQNSTDINAAVSFVLYAIAFILPLLIITVLLSKGRTAFEVSEAVREKMPLIKLVNALFFLVFIIIIICTF